MMRTTLLAMVLGCTSSVAFAQGSPATSADPHAGHTMPLATAGDDAAQQPVTPVPPLTDEDRGAAFPPDLHGHAVHDSAVHSFVLFDQLEWQAGGSSGVNWDTTAWIGGDLNRIWIHSEGASEKSRLDEAELHVTYGRAFSRWWDVVAGVRHDVRPGPGQTWGTIGLQGLAPQWFEIQATLYVGESASTLARFEAEYELLLTNRLMLQPLVELNLYGKAIPERQLGAGLSSAETGLRLRYEIRREFAPYVGVVWNRKFGGTADFSRAAGDDIGGWRIATGVRTWF